MRYRAIVAASLLTSISALALVTTARADGNVHSVNHVIIIMQENHSFDNYLGALPYAPGGPYHTGPCKNNDNNCVDGLTCTFDMSGNLSCSNSNLDDDSSTVTSFHDFNYCPGPDLQHNWQGSHGEANFSSPANALLSTLNDGFVLVNDLTEQIDTTESPNSDDTMGFYTQDDLSFYYSLAQTFAIDDRYFCSVVGPTFPNRSYEMTATSFGHVTTNEIFPPGINPANPAPLNTSIGYQPITGSIFDLLDANGVQWFNYFEDLPTSVIFRGNHIPFLVAHVRSVSGTSPFGGQSFMAAAAAGTLPPVSFVDPSFAPDQVINGNVYETDEHPPFDIRAGQFFTSQV